MKSDEVRQNERLLRQSVREFMGIPPKLNWFCRAAPVAKSGPYNSQQEAWKACMGHDGTPVEGAVVWCEEVDTD